MSRPANPTLILFTASVGCALTVLDTNVVAVVLPTIARDLGASFAEIEWVISTYILCFASLLLPAGAIADRFGRKKVFLAGIALFAAASLLCGVAPSTTALYLARALQGIGAAVLLPSALAIIAHTFHGEAERNRAWAIWGGMMGLTMVLSPMLGGVIADLLGWRWAFNVNLPVCLALAAAVLAFVDESADANARRLDPIGILSFSSAMFGLTWGLINGQAQGWGSLAAICGFAGSIVAFGIFIAAELMQERPMLDLKLFRLPRFVGAVLAMFAYAGCAQVMASLLPLFLQNGLGRTPLATGFAMLPFALAMLILPQVGRRLNGILASEQVLFIGLALVAAGDAVTGWGAHIGASGLVIGGMALLGSGGGLLNGETQKAIMSVVPRERAGMASGISTTARFSGILLGFAVLSGVIATTARGVLTRATYPASFADAVVAGDLPRALAGISPDQRDMAAAQAAHAYGSAFGTALCTAAVVAGICALLIRLLMRPVPSAPAAR